MSIKCPPGVGVRGEFISAATGVKKRGKQVVILYLLSDNKNKGRRQ
jgi:hypothetical protein